MSMIRSLLEFSCQLWHPGLTKQQSLSLESIQKRAMKIIFPEMDYDAALCDCRLEKLSVRRHYLCGKTFQRHANAQPQTS